MTAKTRNRAEPQSVALKTNPPYPPCQGGMKKQNPLSPEGAHRLFYPPVKGG